MKSGRMKNILQAFLGFIGKKTDFYSS